VKLLTLLLLACTAAAQTGPVPEWFLSGMNRTQFGVKLDREVVHGGNSSARIECFAKRCQMFGTLMQTIKADAYLGQRIRLIAWVKALDAGQPRIWVRIDGEEGETLAFDNMDGRAQSGSFDWKLQQIVLDVNKHAALINFGFMLQDRGIAWIDDVSLEVVDRSVKTTGMLHTTETPTSNVASIRNRWEKSSERPMNLDFERQQTERQ
jgi:hypothetical protein